MNDRGQQWEMSVIVVDTNLAFNKIRKRSYSKIMHTKN